MPRVPLLHEAAGDELSKCGKVLRPEYLTYDQTLVSCGSCRRDYGDFNARSIANRKARAMEGYADPDFKGTGFLRCFHCDRPIREHPVAAVCPFPPASGLTVSR